MPRDISGGEELMLRIASGDESAFNALYSTYSPGIYRFALHMTGSAAMAEDISQEVFLTVIRQPGRYSPSRGSVSAYLYGIARKHTLRCIERERPGERIPDGAIPQNDGLADLARLEAIDMVRQVILSLPPHYREVIVLCELQEMEYAQAAAALGCGVGTVRSRLHRARALLLEKLQSSQVSGVPAGCLRGV